MTQKVIKATNDAKSLKIENVGLGQVKLTAVFDLSGTKSERTFSWLKVIWNLIFLQPTKHVDFDQSPLEFRIARFEKTDAHLYFEPPTKNFDLIVVNYSDLIGALLKVWWPLL